MDIDIYSDEKYFLFEENEDLYIANGSNLYRYDDMNGRWDEIHIDGFWERDVEERGLVAISDKCAYSLLNADEPMEFLEIYRDLKAEDISDLAKAWELAVLPEPDGNLSKFYAFPEQDVVVEYFFNPDRNLPQMVENCYSVSDIEDIIENGDAAYEEHIAACRQSCIDKDSPEFWEVYGKLFESDEGVFCDLTDECEMKDKLSFLLENNSMGSEHENKILSAAYRGRNALDKSSIDIENNGNHDLDWNL